MKYTFTLLICLTTYFAYGQAVDSLGCTGAVGDMKFSILELPDFQKENGDCWILMGGQNVASSKLGAYGFQSIPNPQGLFLRVHDTRPDAVRADFDRSFNTPVGTMQEDLVQTHQHVYHDAYFGTTINGNGNLVGTWATINNATIEQFERQTLNVGEDIGRETRPKNMNFHLYIRIN